MSFTYCQDFLSLNYKIAPLVKLTHSHAVDTDVAVTVEADGVRWVLSDAQDAALGSAEVVTGFATALRQQRRDEVIVGQVDGAGRWHRQAAADGAHEDAVLVFTSRRLVDAVLTERVQAGQ